MQIPVLAAFLRRAVADLKFTPSLSWRWHAGEPLTAPISFYESSNDLVVEELGAVTEARFSLQTNGTLITREWISHFLRYGVDVGVSVDGPAFLHDANRVTRSNRGTHRQVMRGLSILANERFPYSVISVVSPATIRHSDAFWDFMSDLSPTSLGLNVEETEGAHESALLSGSNPREFLEFLAQGAAWSRETGIPIRQLENMRYAIASGFPAHSDQNQPLSIVSLSAGGGVGSFSPEFLGWQGEKYGDFLIGNVLDSLFTFGRWSSQFEKLAMDVEAGVASCRAECGYFSACGGGAPANKYWERGDASVSVTESCRLNVRCVAEVALADPTPISRRGSDA